MIFLKHSLQSKSSDVVFCVQVVPVVCSRDVVVCVQVVPAVCSLLYRFYQSAHVDLRRFTLDVVPTLVFTYLSACSRAERRVRTALLPAAQTCIYSSCPNTALLIQHLNLTSCLLKPM